MFLDENINLKENVRDRFIALSILYGGLELTKNASPQKKILIKSSPPENLCAHKNLNLHVFR